MNRRILNVFLIGLVLLSLQFAVSCKKSSEVAEIPAVSTTLTVENVEVAVEKLSNGYRYTIVAHLRTSAGGSGVNLSGVEFTISFLRENQTQGTVTFGSDAFNTNHVPPSSSVVTKNLVLTNNNNNRQATRASITVNYRGHDSRILTTSHEFNIPEEKNPPVIDYLLAGSNDLEYGEATTIGWKVSNADDITLFHNDSPLKVNALAEELIVISPQGSGTHIYKLKATNSDGTVEKELEISVAEEEDEGGGGGPIVYITDTGEKYHRYDCRYLDQSKKAISLEEAKAQGYEPCKVCKPPQ